MRSVVHPIVTPSRGLVAQIPPPGEADVPAVGEFAVWYDASQELIIQGHAPGVDDRRYPPQRWSFCRNRNQIALALEASALFWHEMDSVVQLMNDAEQELQLTLLLQVGFHHEDGPISPNGVRRSREDVGLCAFDAARCKGKAS